MCLNGEQLAPHEIRKRTILCIIFNFVRKGAHKWRNMRLQALPSRAGLYIGIDSELLSQLLVANLFAIKFFEKRTVKGHNRIQILLY